MILYYYQQQQQQKKSLVLVLKMTRFISNLRLPAGFMAEHPASSDHRDSKYFDGEFLSKPDAQQLLESRTPATRGYRC